MVLPSVFSYIDPVSGTILLQVVLAGIIGTVAFFRRTLWAVVSKVFRARRSDETIPD